MLTGSFVSRLRFRHDHLSRADDAVVQDITLLQDADDAIGFAVVLARLLCGGEYDLDFYGESPGAGELNFGTTAVGVDDDATLAGFNGAAGIGWGSFSCHNVTLYLFADLYFATQSGVHGTVRLSF